MNPGTTSADTQTILSLLRGVKRRTRMHRLTRELTLAFCIALIFPILLKVWDLYSPLQIRTVTVAVAMCAGLFTAYAIWRLLLRETIDQAAVSLDSNASLHDQMTTACWFITNGLSSDWIHAQFRGAAQAAAGIDVRRLYPRVIPRTFWFAATLIVLFAGLNFVPLSLNHNWLKLQAAPAGVLSTPDNELPETQQAQQTQQTKQTATEFLREQLQKAADELRKLAGQLGSGKPESERESEQESAELTKQTRLDRTATGQNSRRQQGTKDGQKQEGREQAADGKESGDEGTQQQESKGQNGQPRPGTQEAKGQGRRGRSADEKSERENEGTGDDPNGNAPRTGAQASLEVQLEQERVAAMPSGGSVPEDVEEISRQQLSKLEYRNLKSQISAAQKDLLNQDGIPWEYRPLIRKYFEAIRPQ